MTADPLAEGFVALAEGRWLDARTAFTQSLAHVESGEAAFGLASALWWLGESHECVERCTRAYALFRRAGDIAAAVQCAVWLAITYKANFANTSAANGWVNRAERLLGPAERGPLHGWLCVAKAYRMEDLERASELSAQAVDVATASGDTDLELVAQSQLGLVHVGKGDTTEGFALLDEAMAVVLAGERTTLDTVVYVCCDMLNACELASDIDRAAQWCAVADEFVDKYGCPFLYAECRIYYGSVLAARGRWDDAARELEVGLHITEGACPGLHARALTRLADLRIRQGRLEDAQRLLDHFGHDVESAAERALSLGALLLAKGDAHAAGCEVERRLHRLGTHRVHLAIALELLVDARLATGDRRAAGEAAERLADAAARTRDGRLAAMAAGCRGRVALASGDTAAAAIDFEAAFDAWTRLDLPFEAARTRLDLARAFGASERRASIDEARGALAVLEGLGATAEADRAAAFLRAAGVTPRIGAKGVGTLTVREREVLGLVARGLSNPEIATRLCISRKTASHHVSNILSKLQLRNRAEAAAYAIAHGSTRDVR